MNGVAEREHQSRSVSYLLADRWGEAPQFGHSRPPMAPLCIYRRQSYFYQLC